jgi:hypothetical protein
MGVDLRLGLHAGTDRADLRPDAGIAAYANAHALREGKRGGKGSGQQGRDQ